VTSTSVRYPSGSQRPGEFIAVPAVYDGVSSFLAVSLHKYLPFFATVNSRLLSPCAMLFMTRSPRDKGAETMIDVWLSVLIISFISAVGGLGVVLIQSCRGEVERFDESELGPSQRRHDGKGRAVL
jgi:hypothetical protein